MPDYDVVIVGAGNAAFAAALSAREHGAQRIAVLEKAPKAQRGGNTHFSGAIFRFVFDHVDQLDRFVPGAEREFPGFHAGVEPYTRADFHGDLMQVTQGRSDPELAAALIDNSYDTVCWLQEHGRMSFELALSVIGVRVGNQIRWPKGAFVRTVHEGVGLSKTWFETAERAGVDIHYDTSAMRLTQGESGRITGVIARGPDGLVEFGARAVVLACGGFETNPMWRRQYLGDPWDHAKVRGSNFNYGDGLKMAMDLGAMPWGHWGGCHATPISADAPDYGRRDLTDKTNRLSYPYGVMLNVEGRRFVDEAENLQSLTYAKYGGLILKQPRSLIYQIFDSKVLHLLEPRYSTTEPFKANTLEALVAQLDLDRVEAMRTLTQYNTACPGEGSFDPVRLDGLRTEGITPVKSNWSQRIDSGPFYAWPVTGGITFTFGGLKITGEAQVVSTDWKPMPGLYTCGEMVGGLFHYNYPLGTGLISGAVFGRIAGRSAALAK